MSATRTFVAVAVSDAMRDHAVAAIDALRPAARNVTWVPPENLHWTLHFLGDLDDAQVAAVCRHVTAVAAGHAAFTLAAAGLGAFPSVARPHTIWLGAGAGGDALAALHDAIEPGLRDLGLGGERRRFVPHLTLGRVRRARPAGRELGARLRALHALDAGTMTVDAVTVFASELRPQRALHRVLARAPLAAPPPTPA